MIGKSLQRCVVFGGFLLAFLCSEASFAQQGQRRALVLASNVADSQLAAPRCLQAAKQISGTLERVGFAAADIVTLLADDPSGAKSLHKDSLLDRVATLANQAAAQDVIVLVMLGTGVATAEGDAVLLPHDNPADSSVLISELLEKLGTSAAGQQVLIVDGNGFSKAGEFGFNKPRGTDKQQILLNVYSPSVNAAGEALPAFHQILCDGLTELSDQNSDGRITGDELSEYVLGYFDTRSLLPAPLGSGQLGEGFVVSVPAEGGASRFSQHARDQIASRMLQNAHQVLLVEHQPERALEMLQRATSYRPGAVIKRQIRGLWLCSMASRGDFSAAWALAAADGQPLMVWVGRSVMLQGGGQSIATDENGEVLELQSRNGESFSVSRRMQVQIQNGSIRFTEVPVAGPSLTVSTEALSTGTAADVSADDAKFLQSLRKL